MVPRTPLVHAVDPIRRFDADLVETSKAKLETLVKARALFFCVFLRTHVRRSGGIFAGRTFGIIRMPMLVFSSISTVVCLCAVYGQRNVPYFVCGMVSCCTSLAGMRASSCSCADHRGLVHGCLGLDCSTKRYETLLALSLHLKKNGNYGRNLSLCLKCFFNLFQL